MNKVAGIKKDLNNIRVAGVGLVVAIVIACVLIFALSSLIYNELITFESAGWILLLIHTMSTMIGVVLSQKAFKGNNCIGALSVLLAYIAVMAFACIAVFDGSIERLGLFILASTAGTACGYLINFKNSAIHTKRRKRKTIR